MMLWPVSLNRACSCCGQMGGCTSSKAGRAHIYNREVSRESIRVFFIEQIEVIRVIPNPSAAPPIETRRTRSMPFIVRRFRLAPKVRVVRSEPISNRAVWLMKGQGDLAVVREGRRVFSSSLSSMAAGGINAYRKSTPAAPQQSIQRRFSLWTL